MQGGWRAGQMPLFTSTENTEDWLLAQKVSAQEQVLGVSLDAHPLELCRRQIASAGAVSTLEAVGRMGQRVVVAGVRQTSRRSRTAKGEWMMFLSLEDLEGMLDVVIFPDVYRHRCCHPHDPARDGSGGNGPPAQRPFPARGKSGSPRRLNWR